MSGLLDHEYLGCKVVYAGLPFRVTGAVKASTKTFKFRLLAPKGGREFWTQPEPKFTKIEKPSYDGKEACEI